MAEPVVQSSERLWSEEVGRADPGPHNTLDETWGYEFSNGQRKAAPDPGAEG